MSKKRDKSTKGSKDKKDSKNNKIDDQKWKRPDGYYKEYEARRRDKGAQHGYESRPSPPYMRFTHLLPQVKCE